VRAIIGRTLDGSMACVPLSSSPPLHDAIEPHKGSVQRVGDKDGSDMTSRAVSGWGIADEMGFAGWSKRRLIAWEGVST
jgi:hypothetical protein